MTAMCNQGARLLCVLLGFGSDIFCNQRGTISSSAASPHESTTFKAWMGGVNCCKLQEHGAHQKLHRKLETQET